MRWLLRCEVFLPYYGQASGKEYSVQELKNVLFSACSSSLIWCMHFLRFDFTWTSISSFSLSDKCLMCCSPLRSTLLLPDAFKDPRLDESRYGRRMSCKKLARARMFAFCPGQMSYLTQSLLTLLAHHFISFLHPNIPLLALPLLPTASLLSVPCPSWPGFDCLPEFIRSICKEHGISSQVRYIGCCASRDVLISCTLGQQQSNGKVFAMERL